jgi:hypothetical protein
MKKIIFTTIILAMLLIACNDTETTEIELNTNIEGIWKSIESYPINNTGNIDFYEKDTILIFDNNNYYMYTKYGDLMLSGEYTILSNNKILIIDIDATYNYPYNYSINNDILKIWSFDNGNNFYVIYKRIQ